MDQVVFLVAVYLLKNSFDGQHNSQWRDRDALFTSTMHTSHMSGMECRDQLSTVQWNLKSTFDQTSPLLQLLNVL